MTLRFPGPRQQFVEAVDGVPVDHPLQHVAQIGVRLDVVEAGGLRAVGPSVSFTVANFTFSLRPYPNRTLTGRP